MKSPLLSTKALPTMRKTPAPDQRKRLNASLRTLVEELQPDLSSSADIDHKGERVEDLHAMDKSSEETVVPTAQVWVTSWIQVVIAFSLGIFVGIWISTW